jgi:hypothetical protein
MFYSSAHAVQISKTSQEVKKEKSINVINNLPFVNKR